MMFDPIRSSLTMPPMRCAGPSPGLSHSLLVQTQEQNFSVSSTQAGDPQEGEAERGHPLLSRWGLRPPHTLFLHPD